MVGEGDGQLDPLYVIFTITPPLSPPETWVKNL